MSIAVRRPGTTAAPGLAVYGFMALALASAIDGIWMPPATIVAVIGVAAAMIAARRSHVTHKALRMWLFVLESFIAVTAIQGGAGLLRTSFDLPESWLVGSPFADYVIPGVALVVVVGGTNALAAATVFVERRWALLVAGAAGVVMAGYEVVEIASIDRNVGSDLPVVLAAQLLWLLAGVAVAALSGLMWIRGGDNKLEEVAR